MDVKKPSIKGIPYEEFKDNATLEKTLKELNEGGVNVLVGNLDHLIDWGFANSLWSLTFATSCCGIEFMAVGCARYDFARFGFEVTRNSPRQADLIMCAGTITHKMAPVMRRLYDEMAEPKYVVAVGGCAISGGPFKSSYHVVRGISEIVPVDVYVPGCPPRPEAILYGMMQLQRKVKLEKFIGGVNKKDKTLATIIVKDIPEKFHNMWKSWISRDPEGIDEESGSKYLNNEPTSVNNDALLSENASSDKAISSSTDAASTADSSINNKEGLE